MDEKVRQLLDAIPERAPRSKLEPHAAVIRELRKKRRTYHEIAAFFREHLELPVAPSTLHDFVKTRARQAKSRTGDSPELPDYPNPEKTSSVPAIPDAPQPVFSPSGDAVRDRIQALKSKPVLVNPEPVRFQFDPQEPLTIPSEKKEKKEK